MSAYEQYIEQLNELGPKIAVNPVIPDIKVPPLTYNPIVNSSTKPLTSNITGFRITNNYGLRVGKNAVRGRLNEHSNGIDYVTNEGVAVAPKAGKIIDIRVQGTGNVISPEQGRSAGYYVVMKHEDDSYSYSMHLDRDIWENRENLIGKRLNAGDTIWTYNKLGGSGSMTGPHTKLRMFTDLNNSIETQYDPTPIIQKLGLL